MTTVTIHLAVNNEHGRHTGHVDSLAIYYGHEVVPLMQLSGDAIACIAKHDKRGVLALHIDELVIPYHDYRKFVGNLIWNSASIDMVDAARIVNYVRSQHWTCEEAETSLFDKYHAGQDVTADDLGRAMQQEQAP